MNRDQRVLVARRERLVDTELRGLRDLKTHPLLPIIASVALAYLRPKDSDKWMLRLILT